MSKRNKSQRQRKKQNQQSQSKKQHYQFNQQLTQGFPGNFFYVKDILKQRILPNGRVQLYVSWEGWSSKYNSWVYKDTVMPVEQMWQSVYSQRSSRESLNQNIGLSKMQNAHYDKYQLQQTLAQFANEPKSNHKKKDTSCKQVYKQTNKNNVNIQKQTKKRSQNNNFIQSTVEKAKGRKQSQKQREIKSLLNLTRDIRKDIKQIKKNDINPRKLDQNKITKPFLSLQSQCVQKQSIIGNNNQVSAIKNNLQKGVNSQKNSLACKNKQIRLPSQNIEKRQNVIFISSQSSVNKSEQLSSKTGDIKQKKKAKKDIKQAKKRKQASNKNTYLHFSNQKINSEKQKSQGLITTEKINKKDQQVKIQRGCQQNQKTKKKSALHDILKHKNSTHSIGDKLKFVLNTVDEKQKYNTNTNIFNDNDRKMNSMTDKPANDNSKYIIKLGDQQQISDTGQLSFISYDSSCNSFSKFYDMKKKSGDKVKQKQLKVRNEALSSNINQSALLSSLGVNPLINSSINGQNLCESTRTLNNMDSLIKINSKLYDKGNPISKQNKFSTKSNNDSCLSQSMLLQVDSQLAHNRSTANKVGNNSINDSNTRSNLIQNLVQIKQKQNQYHQLPQKGQRQTKKINNIVRPHNQTSLLLESSCMNNRINMTNSLLITAVSPQLPSRTINNCSNQQSLLLPSLLGIPAVNSTFNNDDLLCSNNMAQGNLMRIQEIQSQMETVSKHHNDTDEPAAINHQSKISQQRSSHPQHREKTINQLHHEHGQSNKLNLKHNKDILRNQTSQNQSDQGQIQQTYIRHLEIDRGNREYTNDKKYYKKQKQDDPNSNKSCPTIIKSTQVNRDIEEIPTGSRQENNEKCIIKQYDSHHSSNTMKNIDQPQSTAFLNNHNISFRLDCDDDLNDSQDIVQCSDGINNEHIRDYLNQLNSGLAQEENKSSIIDQYIRQLKSIKQQIQRNVNSNQQYDKNVTVYAQKYGADEKIHQKFLGTHAIQMPRNRREYRQRHIKQQQEQQWQYGSSNSHNKSRGYQPLEDANNVIYWQPNLSYRNQSSNSSSTIKKKVNKPSNTNCYTKNNQSATEKGVGFWSNNHLDFSTDGFPNAYQNKIEYNNLNK